ncbi:MAG TPA: ABC transporter substrate-binding protein [Symbiobacteriaceae bacterium]|jgi:multiple sugar transport system substrate-binding protein|nr:ABC transporter substrate-binding protein [Symbiobacteriaceae bacterium]
MVSFRKGLAFVLAATMLAAVGCGGKKAPEPTTTPGSGTNTPAPAAPKDPVKIQFWHGMADDSAHGKVLKQLVDKYNASQKEVIVEASYQGSYSDLEKKVTSALQTNNPPAVVQNTDSMLSSLVNQKAVIALDGIVDAKELADFPAGLKKAQTIGGNLYALPFNKSAIVLIYYPEFVPNPPKNWDEFKATAKAATSGTTRYGTAFAADVYYFGTHFGQTGAEWIKDGKANFAGAEGQQALQLIVDMAKDGSAIQLKPKEYQSDYFNQGRAAMIATTSASFAYIKPVDGKPWKVAPLYGGPKGEAVPLSGANLSIVSGLSKEQQDAGVKFMTWLTGKEATLEWAMGKTGYGPVRKSALEDARWKDFVKANPEYGVLGDALTKGVVQPSDSKWSAVQKEITTAVESALLGKQDVKTALEEAATKANALLK